jgi:hypothetical protein
MDQDYKHAKEAFVSDMTGSSIGHINALSLVALVRPTSNHRPGAAQAAADYASPL